MFNSDLFYSFTTIGIGVALLVAIVLFLINLQNTLKAVEPQCRTMKPGKIWLLFIPLFNIVWIFIVVNAIANSAKAQLEKYNVYKNTNPIRNLGLAWAICLICNRLPSIGVLFSFASLILFTLYWIKVNDLRKQLVSLGELYKIKESNSIF